MGLCYLIKRSRKIERVMDMIDDYRDAYVTSCPYCGSSEMIEACQGGYGAIVATSHKLGGCALYHSVCRKCGSIVRSYVKDPEKLLKRRDRRTD